MLVNYPKLVVVISGKVSVLFRAGQMQ